MLVKFEEKAKKYFQPHYAAYAMAFVTIALTVLMVWTGYVETLNISFRPSTKISLWGLPCDTWPMYILCHFIVALEQLFSDLTGAIVGPWMTNYVMNNNVDLDLKQGYGYAVGVFTANNLYRYVNWMLNFKTDVNTMEFTTTQTLVEILVTYLSFKIYYLKKQERMAKKAQAMEGDFRREMIEKLNTKSDSEADLRQELADMRQMMSLLIAKVQFSENTEVIEKTSQPEHDSFRLDLEGEDIKPEENNQLGQALLVRDNTSEGINR